MGAVPLLLLLATRQSDWGTLKGSVFVPVLYSKYIPHKNVGGKGERGASDGIPNAYFEILEVNFTFPWL